MLGIWYNTTTTIEQEHYALVATCERPRVSYARGARATRTAYTRAARYARERRYAAGTSKAARHMHMPTHIMKAGPNPLRVPNVRVLNPCREPPRVLNPPVLNAFERLVFSTA